MDAMHDSFNVQQVQGNEIHGIPSPVRVQWREYQKSWESTKFTLPETNIAIAPENSPSQKDIASSNHQFSGAMLVSGSVR